MGFIHIGGKKYSKEDLRLKKFSSHSSYELQTLEFCSQWLTKELNFPINTSGSTGIPKNIPLDRSLMELSSEMTTKALGLQKSDTALVCLNTEMIAGRMMLVRGLENDMDIFVYPPSSNPIKDLSTDSHFDFAAFVPYQIETILKESHEKKNILDNMRAILIGGAPVSSSLEATLQQLNVPCYHTFGMTETVSHIALRPINGRNKSEYFKVFENIKISVDERSCLVIASPFTKMPLVTNDVVELKDESHFRWLGRIDYVINSGGIKIHPEKLEKIIEGLFNERKYTQRFFVTGIAHDQLGESVVLCIEDSSWDGPKTEELLTSIKTKTSRYESPKHIYFLTDFPETASGKIDRLKAKATIGQQ